MTWAEAVHRSELAEMLQTEANEASSTDSLANRKLVRQNTAP